MKTKGWIDEFAVVLAVGALVVGGGGIALVSTDCGIRLAVENGQVVITDVLPYSPASLGFPMATAVGAGPGSEVTSALRPGMIVTNLNGTTLISLPQEVYADGQPSSELRNDPGAGAQAPKPVAAHPARQRTDTPERVVCT
jgi:hypothetical protein